MMIVISRPRKEQIQRLCLCFEDATSLRKFKGASVIV